MADIKKALVLKKYTNPTIKVPVYYYKCHEIQMDEFIDKKG